MGHDLPTSSFWSFVVICEYLIVLFEVILFEYKFMAVSDLITWNPNSSSYTQCHSIKEMHTQSPFSVPFVSLYQVALCPHSSVLLENAIHV